MLHRGRIHKREKTYKWRCQTLLTALFAFVLDDQDRYYEFVLGMARLKQSRLTDYFQLHKPNLPGRLLVNDSSSVQVQAIRTILDLPNEILLYILDLQCTQPTDLNSATQLYAVCRRFYSLYVQYAFGHLSCIGTKQLFLLNQSLKGQQGNISPTHVTLVTLSLYQLPLTRRLLISF
jgi:hypothetical protein